jgi:signal transduction histidine kinase
MGVAEYLRERLRRRGELLPPGFSWSFIVISDSAMVVILAASLLQRTWADAPTSVAAALVAVTPSLLFLLAGMKFRPALAWATSGAACVILLFETSTPVASDFSPLLLVWSVAMVGTLSGVVWATLAAGPVAILLITASATQRLDRLALYLSVVALGWLIGYLMRTQTRLLITQQAMQADLAEHAAADERRRIAREVHDVIAHSLSITLLHITGARRALQQDRDVDDAVDALTDAERLGRQAMADIRRTVGLLAKGPVGIAPEPGVADIPDLIDDFVSAGLTVTLRSEVRRDDVSAAIGLALYRIAQESLANVAKHAPISKTTVYLKTSPSTALLSIINELPVAVPAAAATPDGRGLAGMRQRVELLGGMLRAGPSCDGWSVRAEIPLTNPSPQPRRAPR